MASAPAPPLLLASTSPRRREILEQLRVPFDVVAPEYEETEDDPVAHALGKARSVLADADGRPVLGCDTEVVCEGRVYGKPAGPEDAEEMLESLSGRTHEVMSGLALITPMWEEVRHEVTRVTFRGLTPRDLARYVATGEWEGRAGGYAIQGQGAALVERIEGDYLNVVGLPTALLVRLLAERFPGDVRVRMSESAVRAAVEVAAEHGLRSEDPRVLRDAWHVLVHLRPLPLVARVSSGRPYPEGPPEEDVIRELAVASHAARAGAPVVPPSGLLDAGPHRHGGHVVTFWQYVEPKREVDPVAAGEGLRAIHEALADYEGELPALHTDDLAWITDSLEPSADVELVRELGLRQPAGGAQALHGDSHLANCLPGPLWHDFETACRGPRELDLAALALSARVRQDDASRIALEAYGGHDAGLLEECLPVYAAWVYASFMIALPRRPELGPVLAERLAWLRETYA